MNFKYIINLLTAVVLTLKLTISALAGIPGDFDNDGDTDVFDFGVWQRNPVVGNLIDWEANFGITSTSVSRVNDLGDPNGEVSLSLNLYPNSISNPSAGGTWDLVAKTTSDGISALMVVLNDVSPVGITLANGLGTFPFYATSDGSGSITQFLYGQDINDTIVPGVGTPSFVSAVPVDPLGDPTWNLATTISSGNYGGVIPSFGKFDSFTQANVFSNSASSAFLANGVSLVVRKAVPEPTTAIMFLVESAMASTLFCRRI